MRLLTFMLMGPLAWWLAAMAPLAHSQTASAAAQLSAYTALAGVPAQAGRGEAFFNVRHGRDWACASCHGAVPTGPGKHASTPARQHASTPARAS